HGEVSLDVDAVDAELDDILTVAVLPLCVVLPALLLEDDDLVAAGLAKHRGHDRSALDRRRAELGVVAADQQHLMERDFVLIDRAEDVALDADRLPFSDPILLSTRPNDGVHGDLRKMSPASNTDAA